MSGVPMQADAGRAFSGGALSERSGAGGVEGPSGNTAGNAMGSTGQVVGLTAPGRSESVTHHEAAPALGGTGGYRVLELPRTVEVARYPTLEAAQAYALALNNWLAARPDPSHVAAFFDGTVRVEPTYEGLLAIFERMLRPETP